MQILTNQELIDLNQDRAGVQGRVVDRQGGQGELQVWSKSLQDGSVGVALYNHGNSTAEVITADFGVVGLSESASCRDLWLHRDLGVLKTSIIREVQPHECFVFRCHNHTSVD
eukprot:TRINITY_DN26160_c0_g1_i3.p1 TRINITY_DN26160_c0_g1~~TRINITY_DN26160_c0_g1_i3.p1  ORF type:complete len:113 (-),score=22.19 TRINITY_DN26160_c0_g1_i3:199-537(-)